MTSKQCVVRDTSAFTPEAEALARQEGMMISDQAQIERLAKIVRRA